MVSAPNDGGPAFPPQVVKDADGQFQEAAVYGMQSGMTLRDYFAARAMHAGLTSEAAMQAFELEAAMNDGARGEQAVAQAAYRMADAMLKARSS